MVFSWIRTHLSRFTLAVLSVSTLFFTLQSNAQTTAVASVDGIVSDSTGRAIVNTAVKATETDKGLVRTTITNLDGRYTLPNLPVGPYRLEVKANGIQGLRQQTRNRSAGQQQYPDQRHDAGGLGLSERVEVSAATSMVETKENSISVVIDAAAHQRTAAERAAGDAIDHERWARPPTGIPATPAARPSTAPPEFRWPADKATARRTCWMAATTRTRCRTSICRSRSPTRSRSSAWRPARSRSRFGTHPGATVNVVTKSGSNAFHGDLFEYLRNGDVNARNFFAAEPRQPEAKPVRRNRRRQDHQGQAVFLRRISRHAQSLEPARRSPRSFPHAAMLTGDFSAIASGPRASPAASR